MCNEIIMCSSQFMNRRLKRMLKYIYSDKKSDRIIIDQNAVLNELDQILHQLKSINKDLENKHHEEITSYLLLDVHHNNIVYKTNYGFLYVNRKNIITYGLTIDSLYILDNKNIFHYYSDKCIFKIIFIDAHKESLKI
ncbi:hypothetical protein PFDG_04971 [Plasmodium falciparum Dd2]|uniref:Uncharacterized protein n=1 Tax=Plasmodium falciparum (isolate Dd2) TaxID=57267 RepID=A0A0L7M9C6_PLAF4|nr:hypothetical protein PFDG_04971 [Plasmodium falciparum Dd2]